MPVLVLILWFPPFSHLVHVGKWQLDIKGKMLSLRFYAYIYINIIINVSIQSVDVIHLMASKFTIDSGRNWTARHLGISEAMLTTDDK